MAALCLQSAAGAKAALRDLGHVPYQGMQTHPWGGLGIEGEREDDGQVWRGDE